MTAIGNEIPLRPELRVGGRSRDIAWRLLVTAARCRVGPLLVS